MNTNDFNRPLNSDALNESLEKAYNVRINFDKYTREQLENYRNLLRTKVHQVENAANFNELLSNEVYQKDKFVLNVLNTRIKEMLGEGKEVVAEKAKSKAQQKFMGMVHAAQKGEKPASKEVAKVAKGMSKKAAKDYASTKHKGLPAHVDEDQVNELSPETIKSAQTQRHKQLTNLARTGQARMRNGNDTGAKASPHSINQFHDTETKAINRDFDQAQRASANYDPAERDAALANNERNRARNMSRGNMLNLANKKLQGTANVPAKSVGEGTKMKKKSNAKPDFLDMDKDGNKKEPMKKAIKDKKIKEAAKPDYIDLDKDGNKKETMKKAAADKKKKAVKESIHELRHRAYQNFIAEGLAQLLAEDEEGKAKAITAGADMVNDFTSWMQRVGNYQTKSMIELADNIRANFGVQQAETFKASVGQALEGALNALTTAREEINNAVAVLAGEAPPAEPMGQEPSMGGDVHDLDAASPDAMNLPSMDDEFAASDAAAGGMETSGRMKRESIDRGNRLMKILGA